MAESGILPFSIPKGEAHTISGIVNPVYVKKKNIKISQKCNLHIFLKKVVTNYVLFVIKEMIRHVGQTFQPGTPNTKSLRSVSFLIYNILSSTHPKIITTAFQNVTEAFLHGASNLYTT